MSTVDLRGLYASQMWSPNPMTSSRFASWCKVCHLCASSIVEHRIPHFTSHEYILQRIEYPIVRKVDKSTKSIGILDITFPPRTIFSTSVDSTLAAKRLPISIDFEVHHVRNIEKMPIIGTIWNWNLAHLQGGLKRMKHNCTPMNCTLSLRIRHWTVVQTDPAEIRDARNALASPQVPEEAIPNVVHHLGRVNEILKLAGDTFSVMETLTPQDSCLFETN